MSEENITGTPLEDDYLEEPVAELPPPPSFQSVLMQFLKQLATVSTDLHQLTCPAVMLNGVSLLEYGKHWGDHPDLFARISEGKSPQERLVNVIRWYVSTLYGSYVGRTVKSGGFERKPYNPILGEQFNCSWPNSEIGETVLTSEQVSHHPPMAAFQLANKQAGVYLNGHCGQKTKFSGTAIQVEQTGCLFVFVEKYGEEYAISLPELYLRGLVTGAPFVEITGECLVVCSRHDYAAKIRFIPKPWFSGSYNLVEGIVYNDKTQEVTHEIYGNWAEKTFIQNKETDPEDTHLTNIESGVVDCDDPSAELLFDSSEPIVHPRVKNETPLDSRNVWKNVTDALVHAKYELAASAKNEIEEAQRALRKERAANGIQWLPINFNYMPSFFLTKNYDSTSLSNLSGPNISTESLILIRNLDINKSSGSLSSTSDGSEDISGESADSERTIERKTVEKIKFTGRWVSYEFLDMIEKKK